MDYYIYNRGSANGIRVIVDNLIDAFRRNGIKAIEVSSLEKCPKSALVIPYGVLESWRVAKAGYKTKLALLVDAISLGYRNKIVFYMRRGFFFHYDFFYSIYGYIRYSWMEKQVMKSFDSVMLVSQIDIDYLKRRCRSNKKVSFVCVPNGVNEVERVYEKSKSDRIRIGVLSSFMSKQSYEENNWFFRSFYKKYARKHPEVEIIVAGRGEYINRLNNLPSVSVMGEVKDLNDFFTSIDIFLSLNPKGCGILNRVLDAVAYKTATMGVENSFSGFSEPDICFVSFNDYNTFSYAVETLKDESYRNELINKASSIIMKNHNWVLNYDLFINKILSIN